MSWGKLFASMYTGSLFGKPALVFAIWTYAIAHMRPSRKDGECYVELNAVFLAAVFATTIEAVLEALGVLEAPDPASRSKADEGRRLILLEGARFAGPMQYRVVNGTHYRAIRDEEERREQNRQAKRAERDRKRVSNVISVSAVSQGQPRSAQAEAEAEAEAEKTSSDSPNRTPRILFEERWSKYPRKDGKREAQRHFKASVKDEIQLARFDRALANYLDKIRIEKPEPKYIKNGSTFFANWEDFVDYDSSSPVQPPRLIV